MKRSFWVVPIMFLSLQLDASDLQAQRPTFREDVRSARVILREINALRNEEGAPALELHEGLSEAATIHSLDMARHQELGHVSARTGSPRDRVRAVGVRAERIAENVSRGSTAERAHASILASDAHRAQLLDPTFTHLGLSVVQGSGRAYITQLFAVLSPREEPLPPPSVEAPRQPEPQVQVTQAPAAQPAQNQTQELRREQRQVHELDLNTTDPRIPQVLDMGPGMTPRIRVPPAHQNAAGYWVYERGRWWYFPVPPGTQPGTIVSPDLRYEGPPPGVQDEQPSWDIGERTRNHTLRVAAAPGRAPRQPSTRPIRIRAYSPAAAPQRFFIEAAISRVLFAHQELGLM